MNHSQPSEDKISMGPISSVGQSVQIEQVFEPAQHVDFIDLPYQLYREDPIWVPPLRMQQREAFDFKNHPFYKHGRGAFFLARDDEGRACGRIAAFMDQDFLDFHQEKTAFFGFFESVNRAGVAAALFDAASRWAKAEGADKLQGPYNLNTNYECGLLVEGFDDPPFVGMNYHPPYYHDLLRELGFEKAMDLYAYYFYLSHVLPPKVLKMVDVLKRRYGVTIRTMRPHRFDEDVEVALDIYNDAWERNWGFIPLSKEEFRFRAQEMRKIMDPELIYFIEVKGKPAAFSLGLPDIHQAQISVRSGNLFPFHFAPFVWKLRGPKKREYVNRIRVLSMGVKREFQHLGLGALAYAEYFDRGKAAGYRSAECSWILETNQMMIRSLEMMNAKREKVYRILERKLI